MLEMLETLMVVDPRNHNSDNYEGLSPIRLSSTMMKKQPMITTQRHHNENNNNNNNNAISPVEQLRKNRTLDDNDPTTSTSTVNMMNKPRRSTMSLLPNSNEEVYRNNDNPRSPQKQTVNVNNPRRSTMSFVPTSNDEEYRNNDKPPSPRKQSRNLFPTVPSTPRRNKSLDDNQIRENMTSSLGGGGFGMVQAKPKEYSPSKFSDRQSRFPQRISSSDSNNSCTNRMTTINNPLCSQQARRTRSIDENTNYNRCLMSPGGFGVVSQQPKVISPQKVLSTTLPGLSSDSVKKENDHSSKSIKERIQKLNMPKLDTSSACMSSPRRQITHRGQNHDNNMDKTKKNRSVDTSTVTSSENDHRDEPLQQGPTSCNIVHQSLRRRTSISNNETVSSIGGQQSRRRSQIQSVNINDSNQSTVAHTKDQEVGNHQNMQKEKESFLSPTPQLSSYSATSIEKNKFHNATTGTAAAAQIKEQPIDPSSSFAVHIKMPKRRETVATTTVATPISKMTKSESGTSSNNYMSRRSSCPTSTALEAATATAATEAAAEAPQFLSPFKIRKPRRCTMNNNQSFNSIDTSNCPTVTTVGSQPSFESPVRVSANRLLPEMIPKLEESPDYKSPRRSPTKNSTGTTERTEFLSPRRHTSASALAQVVMPGTPFGIKKHGVKKSVSCNASLPATSSCHRSIQNSSHHDKLPKEQQVKPENEIVRRVFRTRSRNNEHDQDNQPTNNNDSDANAIEAFLQMANKSMTFGGNNTNPIPHNKSSCKSNDVQPKKPPVITEVSVQRKRQDTKIRELKASRPNKKCVHFPSSSSKLVTKYHEPILLPAEDGDQEIVIKSDLYWSPKELQVIQRLACKTASKFCMQHPKFVENLEQWFQKQGSHDNCHLIDASTDEDVDGDDDSTLSSVTNPSLMSSSSGLMQSKQTTSSNDDEHDDLLHSWVKQSSDVRGLEQLVIRDHYRPKKRHNVIADVIRFYEEQKNQQLNDDELVRQHCCKLTIPSSRIAQLFAQADCAVATTLLSQKNKRA